MAKKSSFKKVREIKVKRDSSHTENSSYWEHVRSRGKSADVQEHPQANPDILPETEIAASTPQRLMGEAVEHLQGRQREVYMLVMRENKSLSEVAELLGIAKGAADTYKRRAIKFISQYCKNAIAKGRV